MKNTVAKVSILTMLLSPTLVMADNYFFRSPVAGVKAQNSWGGAPPGGGSGGEEVGGDEEIVEEADPVAISLLSTTLPVGVEGEAYTFDFKPHLSVTGASVNDISWNIVGGDSLPTGISLNTSSGVLSGVPNYASQSSFDLRASFDGEQDIRQYTLTIESDPDPISISLASTTLPDAQVGEAYSFDFSVHATVSGADVSDLTWAISGGDLPQGVSLDSGQGVISGTPEVSEEAAFEVRAFYSGEEAIQSYELIVTEPIEISLAGMMLPDATQNEDYTFDFRTLASVSGASVNDLSWSIGSGESPLPDGLSMSSSTGVLSGAPSESGETLFEVMATYEYAGDSQVYVLNVNGVQVVARSLSVGNRHVCAITLENGVKCWGNNAYGQLGNGTTTNSITPVSVSGLSSGVARISSSQNYTCAVTTSGGAKCWGAGGFGNLGNGSYTDRSTPVDVSGLTSGVSYISTGWARACAVTTSGAAKCWGLDGALGDGNEEQTAVPVDVQGLQSGVNRITAGPNHTCAVLNSGHAYCWGYNGDNSTGPGQLGDGTTTRRLLPTQISNISGNVSQISAGADHTCAVTTYGAVYCWGSGRFGQVGNGVNLNGQNGGTNNNADSYVPSQVVGLDSGMSRVVNGNNSSCAVNTSGGVVCWGRAGLGALGDGQMPGSNVSNRSSPVQVIGITSGVSTISKGNVEGGSVCVMMTGGTAKCWGKNLDGMLGDGTTTDSGAPVDVTVNFN